MSESKSRTDLVFFVNHKKPDGSVLLEIKLNNPKKLNVLSREMIQALHREIKARREDRDLALVFIHSAGERAFCAGGDVVWIRSQILKSRRRGQDPTLLIRSLFQAEYELNYMLWRFPRPVVTWGDGIVMGGGMGLLMASSHPVLTQTSRLAMPEAGIGFFPDVGASFFFNQIQKDIGRYLALVSYLMNAREAVYLNLASFALPREAKERFFQFLIRSSFKSREEFDSRFKNFCARPDFLETQDNWLKRFEAYILKALEFDDIVSFARHMNQADGEDKKWKKHREIFFRSAPLSLAVIFEQLRRAKSQKSLKKIFEMELAVAIQKAQDFDFLEGVRALLVDKTKDPAWQPRRIEHLKLSDTDRYFKASKDYSLRV